MIFFIFLISNNFLNAFNEDLTAVHYSIVTPGIDEEIKPGNTNSYLSLYNIFNIICNPYDMNQIKIYFRKFTS